MWTIFWLSDHSKFDKTKKRYCCICQFQDDYHLLKLNEIKRDIVKLRKNYSNIMKDLCEIKKVSSTEENFWERDIHYVLNNNGLRFCLNEMKDFLFKFRGMDNNFKNLLLTILFVIFIGIVFGFTFKNLQFCIISFCFGYYLSKRKLPQVYVKINDCIFRLSKWIQK